MELHQFACIVFIQATGGAVRTPATICHALGLVQIQQHGRMAGTGQQQVFKLAHGMGARHIHDVVPGKRSHGTLACINIEVVEPEFGHARQERRLHLGLPVDVEPPGCGLLDLGSAEGERV